MILRKFKKHINEENWFAVSVDFLVVVVGIFVGLQVEGWNQDRKDRIEEREYIERLQGDMMGTITLLEVEKKEGEEAVNATRFILQALWDKKLLEKDRASFKAGLTGLGQISDIRILDSTLREMQSTGRLALIQSKELKVQIGKFDEILRTARIENTKTDEMASRQFQEVIKHFRWHPDPGNQAIRYDFDAMLESPSFYNHLAILNGSRERLVLRVVRVLEEVKKLDKVLLDHLNKP